MSHWPKLTASVLLGLLPSSVWPQIQDNSFLLEEAYNQESGIVQHISAFGRSNSGDWEFSFTQEWPLGGIRHQLSYTVPVENTDGTGAGLGDVALNYRFQLTGGPDARTVAAPRVSILLPTGNEDEGRGAGGLGLQVNLPLSLVLADELVAHWNGGLTLIPAAQDRLGNEATTHSFNLGASVIWLVQPNLNLLVESVWNNDGVVVGEGRVARQSDWTINPGVRGAVDLGELQIVPGAAYTIGLREGSEDNGVFLYLSFEHPFRRQ
jgi:hypothetical protein